MADYDLAIIGGGINGTGIARDAAGRGVRVLVLEQNDLGSGTSSKSSKLVHGGLRYLQNGELTLVKEALRERQRLLDNAPHLVRPLPFVIPVFDAGGAVPAKLAKALGSALWAYDRAGGARIGKSYQRLEQREIVELALGEEAHPLEGRGPWGVGRSQDNEIVINDPNVSRRHARISRADNGFVVEDLGSTNGTLLDGAPIDREMIEGGDELTFGQTTARFIRRIDPPGEESGGRR